MGKSRSFFAMLALMSIGSFGFSQPNDYAPVVIVQNGTLSPSLSNKYWTTTSEYFHDPKAPQFIFSTPNNRFSLGIGGYVNATVNYEFDGYAPGPDLIPSNITTPNNSLNDGQLNFDARTSRLFFKVIDQMPNGKDLIAYIETDFRGGANYLRLRKAYVSYGKFLVGQDWTTMLDLKAFPAMVNFQGPNGAFGNRQIMIRYTQPLGENWKMVAALEEPSLTLNSLPSQFYNKPQRYPQVPLYFQYAKNGSHIRATGLLQPLIYRNTFTNKNRHDWGWAAQLSGLAQITPIFSISFNGFYGEGVGNLTQDLSGSGYDLIPVDNANPQKLENVPVWGGYAAVLINTSQNTFISGGYSLCNIDVASHYKSAVPDWYKEGQMIWGNIFWNPMKFMQLGLEYSWGKRTNVNDANGTVNRVSAMVQYNF